MAYRQRATSYEDEDRYNVAPPYTSSLHQTFKNNHLNVTRTQEQQPQEPVYGGAQELHRYSQNADRFSTNRTNQWTNSNNNNYHHTNGLHTSTNNLNVTSVGIGSGSTGSNEVMGSNNNNSQRGSQSVLISVKNKGNSKWPKGKDFLFSTWAFVIGAHSLWEFPILTLKYGGVVFVLIYLFMFLLIGVPMLLLEMTLGQYSGLTPTRLFRNLCPAFTGVGFAVLVSLLFHTMADLAAVTWSAHAIFLLFTGQALPDNFFYSKVLDIGDATLGNLGLLHGQLTICLGIACIVVFVFIAASTKFMGKISILLVPLCYGLLMTLTIRSCMAEGGSEGILTLLTPDWTHISRPWAWLEAGRFVFVSMQLGMGVITTYASYNKFHHNIIRDTGVIAIGHFVWAILCLLFVFSLLGVANNDQKINIDNLRDPEGAKLFIQITGQGFWLVGVTLAESALGSLDYNWLWSGLLFTLIVLSVLSTLMAAFEVLSASLTDEFPSLKQYKPAIAFTFLAVIFLVNLVMATQGGIHVYYMLTAYLASWPTLLYGLVAVLSAAFSHGGKYLMKDLSDMSKMTLTHYVSAHLSVLYATILPTFLSCILGWTLYKVAQEHIDLPLVNFSMSLPLEWGTPLGWSISFIPILLIILGFLFHILWKARGMPFEMHFKRTFKPTDTWYENEHRELMLGSANGSQSSPVLAYKRGISQGFSNRTNKNITEV